MKKLILDLSKANGAAKRDLHNSIQRLLFAMGFFWGSAIQAPKDEVRFENTNALILNGNDKDAPNPLRKWNHIHKSDSFGPHEHDREYQYHGAEIFDATNPNEVSRFLFAASDLIREKHETIMETTIGGVHVEIGVNGAILDFTELLQQVMTEAHKQWQINYQKG
jgi:hypothetical protein